MTDVSLFAPHKNSPLQIQKNIYMKNKTRRWLVAFTVLLIFRWQLNKSVGKYIYRAD